MVPARSILLFIFLSAGAAAGAQTQRVFIAPDDHTDYLWSTDEDTYRSAFLDMLDYYLDLADATQGNPAPYQSRWACDGSFWLWTYEHNRTPTQFQRLIARIRDGHITVPLNALALNQGGTPVEAVIRGMYYSGRLERRHNLRFRLAYNMENQTHPYGLFGVWAGAGARYSWKGVCACDSLVPDAWDRTHDIYWAVAPDGSRILVKWNSMLTGNSNIGSYAECRVPADTVNFVTTDGNFRLRYPYDIIGCFGKGKDDVATMTDEFVRTAQQMTNGGRQVLVSNEQDFFEEFAARYGAGLPSESCSYGNEWDLYCATLAEASARAKRSLEKLRAAEALAALVSYYQPHFLDGRTVARDQAFMDWGLFWEHDFGMVDAPTGPDGVVARIAWQRRLCDEIDAYVNPLHDDAAAALADLIPAGTGAPRCYVFNPLGWVRTDYADLPWPGTDPVHVVDVSSGAETPAQFVTVDGANFLRILATDVASVGYRVYSILPGPGQISDAAAVLNGSTFENSALRLTLTERGAITSLVDKRLNNQEFAQTLNGRAVNDLGASNGTLTVENAGPVSVTVLATAAAPVQHATRITLYRHSGRVDIRNEITQNFDSPQTWAFSFNLANPFVRHEEVGAILRARRTDQGGDYATHAARYDWLTVNHFADVTGRLPSGIVAGVTLANADCYFMRVGNSTTTSFDITTPQIQVLAGGKVANGNAGLPAQGGDTHFLQRFGLQTHQDFDPATAMRFGLEQQNPCVARRITGATPRLPANQFAMYTNYNPAVLLWAIKPAEEGPRAGIVLRLWNVAESPQKTIAQLSPGAIVAATRTSHLETDEAPAQMSRAGLVASFARQQIRTFRVFPARPGDTNCDRQVDFADILSFVLALSDPPGYAAAYPNCARATADVNGDGDVALSDVSAFVQLLFDGP